MVRAAHGTPLPHRPAAHAVGKPGPLTWIVRRPETGSAIGALAVGLFFAIMAGGNGFLSSEGAAAYLSLAAELGIIAVPVAMLMIAGDFDLSIGSMIGAASMIIAVGVVDLHLPLAGALGVALAFALLVGFINGLVTVRTQLPSFVVTLAALFIVRGVTTGFTRYWTGGTQLGGVGREVGDDGLARLFNGEVGGYPVSILWWLGMMGVATLVLTSTGFGNWIYGTGGDRKAARSFGVKVDHVRIILFMATAAAAVLLSAIQVLTVGSADVLRGDQKEFEAIVAAVIGGTLLRGGYGSAIGAGLGALTYGMASIGITYAGWNSDWFAAVLGTLLLVAVLTNNWFRRKALKAR